MKRSNPIPVVILNGFLGAGKTTLFRSLLTQSEQKQLSVCAIVNDMSELDVDGEIIANTSAVENNQRMLRSISSCVLSSDQGLNELDNALTTLLVEQQPDLIIIETSGSCHPLPLIKFFQSQAHLTLTGVLVLVDSLMLSHDYENGQKLIPQMQQNVSNRRRNTTNLLVEQILFSSHLILTKADRLQEADIQDIATSIHPINPYVSILSVLFGNLSIEAVLAIPEYDYHRVAQLIEELTPALAAEATDDRPYNLATRVLKDERPFHPQRLWEVCNQYLNQNIYRSKGFFWLASRDQLSLLWSQAAGSINLEIKGSWRAGILQDDNNGLNEMEIEILKAQLGKESGRFGDRYCNLTIIGDKDYIDQFVEALTFCFLTEKEIIHWQSGGEFLDPWPQNIVKIVN